MIARMVRRGRHWLLVFAVSFVVLEVGLVVVAWLVASGERGWSRGDAIAVAGVVAALAAGLAAQFGTPLFEQWLDRRSEGQVRDAGADSSVTASDVAMLAIGENVTQSVGGDVVRGNKIVIGSLVAQPVPAQAEGQIVVGEIPGPPPAFVERAALERLAGVFGEGGGVAAVSALTGQRGSGKTQVAAAYARQAIIDGVGLVGWVSADDHGRLLAR
jgi:hypothetical protein